MYTLDSISHSRAVQLMTYNLYCERSCVLFLGFVILGKNLCGRPDPGDIL